MAFKEEMIYIKSIKKSLSILNQKMFYLIGHIGKRSNLENAKAQKAGCEMKRQ